jgi:hypothetical protein
MAQPLFLSKTFILDGVNLSILKKPLYFMTKPPPLGKTFIFHGLTSPFLQNLATSLLKLYLLAKPSYLIIKLLPFGTTFLFHG